MNFRSYYDLSRDIAANIHRLPRVDIVVGLPKSGMIPATIIASFLNVELLDIDAFLFSYARRSGVRKINATSTEVVRVLIVDDSINTGAEFKKTRERVTVLGPGFDYVYCAVYGRSVDGHAHQADIVMVGVPQPRVFQWNYRNHIIAEHACFDMEGVLCLDPEEIDNDDGERYIKFCLNAQPLFIPKQSISAIVTSRLEKFRAPTEEWLHTRGVKYNELIMLDLPSDEERRRLKAHAPFKAEVYKSRDELVFIESNWKQAQQIATLADKPVICTENDAFLSGRSHVERHNKSGGDVTYQSLRREEELAIELAALKAQIAELDHQARLELDSTAPPLRTLWHRERLVKQKVKNPPEVYMEHRSKIRKVLMISSSFDVSIGADGAASSARLRNSLEKSSYIVKTLSLDDFEKLPGSDADQPVGGVYARFWNSYTNAGHSKRLEEQVAKFKPDIVVLGAVGRGVLSLFDIARLPCPIVWVVRDNWPHTGGCLFKLGPGKYFRPNEVTKEYMNAIQCKGYLEGCNDCPTLIDRRESAKTRLQYKIKAAVYSYRSDIVFAPISDWMGQMLKSSPLTSEHYIETVTNPIDLDHLNTLRMPRREARKMLGLPLRKKIILLSAHSLDNPRKGVAIVLDRLMNDDRFNDFLFVTMGKTDPTSVLATHPRFRSLGFLTGDAEKARVYDAVDATLVPAIQESLSVVASDSICSGRPVAAFRTTGLATLIKHRRTGFLAKPFDPDHLLLGLLWIVSDTNTIKATALQASQMRFEAAERVQQYAKLFDVAAQKYCQLPEYPSELANLEAAYSMIQPDLVFRHEKYRQLVRAVRRLETART